MRAIIVDDESRVRRAVRLLVDWDSHGITDIEEAESGNEAMDLIRRRKPELVIMDMMMNEGSGLDLMAWIGEFADTVKFIVVSGHNDFEFVRNTVQHGGVDYILKPIEAEAINAAVAKAVQASRSEENERSAQQRQNIKLNEFKPVYGEKLLSSLIHDSVAAESAFRRLQAEGVIPGQSANARLALLQIDAGDKALLTRFGNDPDLLNYALTNICNEFVTAGGTGIAYKYWGAPDQIILLVWDDKTDMHDLLSRINQGLHMTLQRKAHFGLGQPAPLPASLPAQHAEALAALYERNLLDSQSFIHVRCSGGEQAGSAARIAFAHVREEWRVAVLSGSDKQIREASSQWGELIQKSARITQKQLSQWKTDILDFRLSLLQESLGDKSGAAQAELEQHDRSNPHPALNGYSFSLHAWREWSFELLTALSAAITVRQTKEAHTFRDIVKYVEQHYAEELSLQQIAGAFFVSREYISRKFKQEYAVNFTEYLTAYRMNNAKLLMLNPNLKINQIAEMVGIKDVKYFSKVFKKQEGLSPKDYRSTL